MDRIFELPPWRRRTITVSERSPSPAPAPAPVFGSPPARVSDPTMRMLSPVPPPSSTLPTDTRLICRNLMSAYKSPARINSTGSSAQISTIHFVFGRRNLGPRRAGEGAGCGAGRLGGAGGLGGGGAGRAGAGRDGATGEPAARAPAAAAPP